MRFSSDTLADARCETLSPRRCAIASALLPPRKSSWYALMAPCLSPSCLVSNGVPNIPAYDPCGSRRKSISPGCTSSAGPTRVTLPAAPAVGVLASEYPSGTPGAASAAARGPLRRSCAADGVLGPSLSAALSPPSSDAPGGAVGASGSHFFGRPVPRQGSGWRKFLQL